MEPFDAKLDARTGVSLEPFDQEDDEFKKSYPSPTLKKMERVIFELWALIEINSYKILNISQPLVCYLKDLSQRQINNSNPSHENSECGGVERKIISEQDYENLIEFLSYYAFNKSQEFKKKYSILLIESQQDPLGIGLKINDLWEKLCDEVEEQFFTIAKSLKYHIDQMPFYEANQCVGKIKRTKKELEAFIKILSYPQIFVNKDYKLALNVFVETKHINKNDSINSVVTILQSHEQRIVKSLEIHELKRLRSKWDQITSIIEKMAIPIPLHFKKMPSESELAACFKDLELFFEGIIKEKINSFLHDRLLSGTQDDFIFKKWELDLLQNTELKHSADEFAKILSNEGDDRKKLLFFISYLRKCNSLYGIKDIIVDDLIPFTSLILAITKDANLLKELYLIDHISALIRPVADPAESSLVEDKPLDEEQIEVDYGIKEELALSDIEAFCHTVLSTGIDLILTPVSKEGMLLSKLGMEKEILEHFLKKTFKISLNNLINTEMLETDEVPKKCEELEAQIFKLKDFIDNAFKSKYTAHLFDLKLVTLLTDANFYKIAKEFGSKMKTIKDPFYKIEWANKITQTWVSRVNGDKKTLIKALVFSAAEENPSVASEIASMDENLLFWWQPHDAGSKISISERKEIFHIFQGVVGEVLKKQTISL